MPVAAVAAVIAVLLAGGVPRGNDWSFELVRIVEMRAAFASGQVPPFWAPDEYRGFGSPVFLFYAPLFAWIAAAISMMGALALFVIVAALVMRAAAAEMTGAAMQRIAVIAFVLHPYLLGDMWIRNANAEFAAVAMMPGVIAGAVARDPRRRFWWSALSFTGVMLAHNLTALVAVTIAVCFAVYVQRTWRGIAPTLAGIATAMAITSFFWIPALVLKSAGVREDALIGGKFDFHRNFPRVASFFIIDPPRQYFSGATLGIAMLGGLVVAAAFARSTDRQERRVVQACAIAAIVLIVLMLPVSAVIWERVPLMRYLQFPWRLAGPLAVVTILGFATAIRLERSRMVEAFVVILAITGAVPMFLAHRPVAKKELAMFTPEGIRTFGLRSTVGDEYLPAGADKRLTVQASLPAPPGYVVFRRWMFPVWRATVNGVRDDVIVMPGGVAGVRAAQGEVVRLLLVEPPVRTITKIFSAIALIALGLGVRRQSRRSGSSRAVASPPHS